MSVGLSAEMTHGWAAVEMYKLAENLHLWRFKSGLECDTITGLKVRGGAKSENAKRALQASRRNAEIRAKASELKSENPSAQAKWIEAKLASHFSCSPSTVSRALRATKKRHTGA